MDRSDLIYHAIQICQEYEDLGLTLTLRQLYYQFVARGLSPNGQRHYKRIGATLTEARYNGTFPIHYIEDRGREVHAGEFGKDMTDIDKCEARAKQYASSIPHWSVERSRWFDQPSHVSVWVEKEALSGVVGPTCEDLEVGWFACKGYPSVSALASYIDEVYKLISSWRHDTHRAEIIYLGDHDPDGLEIPLSIERNIRRLQYTLGKPFEFDVHRVALTEEQIEEHNPPPFPAKPSSARFQKYVDETGLMDAWELDALDPIAMRELIHTEVNRFWDEDIHRTNETHVDNIREELVKRMLGNGWLANALDE